MGQHLPSRSYALVLALFFLLMMAFAGWLIFKASGYQILRAPLRIVKTGLISSTIHPNTALTITLNGQTQPSEQRIFSNLPPGRYEIRVTAPDYQPWETTIELLAGQAQQFEEIILFLTKPTETPIPAAETKVYESVLRHPERFQAGLQILGNEVWANDSLVTRFSEPISQALWLPDNAHILVQLTASLHVLELTGGHDVTLYTFPVNEPLTAFAPLAGGEKLVIQTATSLKLLEITAPFQRVGLPSL